MRYTPHTDDQLNRMNLLPDGEYDFTVIEADDKASKNGNDMVTLKLHVYEEDGTPRIIFDYLVPDKMPHKFKHACDACGLIEEYNAGSVTHDSFVNRQGRLIIYTQPAKGSYLEKSAVKDYVKRENMVAADSPRGKQPPPGLLGEGKPLDDDIPF